MNKKCIGCGAVLQFNDKAKEGFIDEKFYEEATYCERCFRIKNYGDYKSVIKDNETFIKIIKNINPTDLVILVADLFNLPENFDLIKENIKNPTVLVLTKRDILPKIVYEEKLLNYIDNYDIEFLDKIIVSSNKNYHFDNLLGMIRKHRTSNNIYVVGFTNAGKSTLINKLIYNYSDNAPSITTSILPSTTLNSIEIKFDDQVTFIDTPGLLDLGRMENYVDVKTLKKITPNEYIKPRTYQVKAYQNIIVENLANIKLKSNNVTFFMANRLKIERFFKDKTLENTVSHTLNVKKGEDIVISGLGFIKVTKNEEITIETLENVLVYTRKSLI